MAPLPINITDSVYGAPMLDFISSTITILVIFGIIAVVLIPMLRAISYTNEDGLEENAEDAVDGVAPSVVETNSAISYEQKTHE